MENQKEVKIIGLSINEKFGNLAAVHLKFDEDNRLTMIKGEVGSGKSTLRRAMELTAKGSETLKDKSLLGDNINIVAQLLDGEMPLFVGCKSKGGDSLEYFIYSTDENGKKINNPVIDGKKATPAAYLKNLQTALTWNLDELTSENPTIQRNILLKTYKNELEDKGVYFDKAHPKYVGSIIDRIEKGKNDRNYSDMKRKECGGIADDMMQKGIDFKERRIVKKTSEIEAKINEIKAEITLANKDVSKAKENALNAIKMRGLEANSALKTKNSEIVKHNAEEKEKERVYKEEFRKINNILSNCYDNLHSIMDDDESKEVLKEEWKSFTDKFTWYPELVEANILKEISFNEKGNADSNPDDFEDEEVKNLLLNYRAIAAEYKQKNSEEAKEADTSELEEKQSELESQLKGLKEYNEEAIAVNSFHDWKEKNNEVKAIQKDYFLKLTEIDTGVKGLHICPEYTEEENGEKVAKGNDIYLMYDGSYDKVYFNNPDKTLRKLAAYSETQKPMICLLIQKHLLSQKSKILPYLWIDNIPIDKKTKRLLDRMAEELNLYLFVNWTGDWDKSNLQYGEILIENGEVFTNLIVQEDEV